MLFRFDEIIKKKIATSEEIKKWCEENLLGYVLVGNISIYIEQEEDAVAFKLRWL